MMKHQEKLKVDALDALGTQTAGFLNSLFAYIYIYILWMCVRMYVCIYIYYVSPICCIRLTQLLSVLYICLCEVRLDQKWFVAPRFWKVVTTRSLLRTSGVVLWQLPWPRCVEKMVWCAFCLVQALVGWRPLLVGYIALLVGASAVQHSLCFGSAPIGPSAAMWYHHSIAM